MRTLEYAGVFEVCPFIEGMVYEIVKQSQSRIVLFILEWLEIVDVPFLEISEFTSGKEKMMHKAVETVD